MQLHGTPDLLSKAATDARCILRPGTTHQGFSGTQNYEGI